MTRDDIVAFVIGLGGVVAQTAVEGDGTPEIAWGDTFFYYSPDGSVPAATQPFATIVTKNYPGEERAGLDRPGAFRVNVAAGRDLFTEHTGYAPREHPVEVVETPDDTVIAHPTYGSLGWLAVVNPDTETDAVVRGLLRQARDLARSRWERRG